MGELGTSVLLARDILREFTDPDVAGIGVWMLVLVFAWSAVAKLRRPRLGAVAIRDFGVVSSTHPAYGIALGMVELSLAVLLMLKVHPAWVLGVAVALLWVFAALITRSLLRGERFDRFCFGESGEGLSRLTLIRTAGLAVMATALAFIVNSNFSGSALPQVGALQAVSAAALIGILVLGSKMPKLLRWNQDPYQIGTMGRSI
jgi:hypothetical protein